MRPLVLGRYALSLNCSAVLLAGCGASEPPTSARGTMPPSQTSATAKRGNSWMLPEATQRNLLYVGVIESDTQLGEVYVFLYPSGKLVGALTGFQNPEGICSDASGNVFVTDADAADIIEYAHGGTTPIKTLLDTGRPSGCWVDPTTGDLAVSNYSSFVSVYKSATGDPINYTTAEPASFVTYDGSGNLFADNRGDPVSVWELRRGRSSFQTITLQQFPPNSWSGGLQWVGSHLTVAHTNPRYFGCCGRIYRYKLRGTNAKKVGSMQPKPEGLSDFFIDGPTAIVATGQSWINFFDYPDGHQPTRTILVRYGTVGVTVSRKNVR